MVDSPVVSFRSMSVRYGRFEAIRRLSFDLLADFGVVGLFGPNGAGKTTTMRVLCGDINRYEGEAVVPSRKDIAYLPDKPFLYRWLSVEQAMMLFSSRHADFRKAVFEHFLEGSNVTMRRRVGELSKGMLERLHLALIMARAPRIYVLDEPLAGVDPLTRDRLLEIIRVSRSEGAPVLLSTHLIQGVERIFDRVMMISDGRLLALGTVEEVRRQGDGDLEQAYKRVVSSYE